MIGDDPGKHRIGDELGKYRSHTLVLNRRLNKLVCTDISQPLKSNSQGRHILQHNFIEDTFSEGQFPQKTLTVY